MGEEDLSRHRVLLRNTHTVHTRAHILYSTHTRSKHIQTHGHEKQQRCWRMEIMKSSLCGLSVVSGYGRPKGDFFFFFLFCLRWNKHFWTDLAQGLNISLCVGWCDRRLTAGQQEFHAHHGGQIEEGRRIRAKFITS